MTDQIGHSVPLMTRRNRRVWLAKRRHVLGATDAVVILLGSKWKTPVDVWMEKTGRYTDDRDSYPMKRGRILEPLLIAEWAAQNPTAALLDHPPLLAHPRHPMVAASLDAAAELDGTQVVIEAKTASWRAREDWWDEDRLIPDAYAAQVLLQLAVTGLDTAHVVADIAGDFRSLVIERDLDFEAWALPALAEWWERHVVAGEVPEMDPVRDYPQMRRLWLTDPGKTITADALLMSDVRAYQHASLEAAHSKGVVEELRGRIRIQMRDASTVLEPDTDRRLVSISKGGALSVTKAHREELTQ